MGLPAKPEDYDLDLIKRTVAPGATNDELGLFIHDCRRLGVHPMDRMLHFMVRKVKQFDGSIGRRYSPIVSIDLMRSQGAETGQMAGSDDAVFVMGSGKFPVSASVTVYRLTSNSGTVGKYSATARWDEYFPGEKAGAMWIKMPHTMLAKCAEALALRKAFPKQLGGFYAHEEMEQAGPGLIGPDVIKQVSPPPQDAGAPTKRRKRQGTDTADSHDPETGEVDERTQSIIGDLKPGLDIIGMAWKAAEHGTEFFNLSFLDMRSIEEKQQLAAFFTKGSENRARLKQVMEAADAAAKEAKQQDQVDHA